MFLNANHLNTVPFPITDANNMSIAMSFDPTRPPPIFFQQTLPSSLSAPPRPLLHQHPQVRIADKDFHAEFDCFQPTDADLRPEDMDADSRQSSLSHHRYDRRRSRSRSREPKRSRSSASFSDRHDSGASRRKETERRRKGLFLPLKEDHLVGTLAFVDPNCDRLSFVRRLVSSRTLRLGHFSKMISEVDLREHLEPHGDINDINVSIERILFGHCSISFIEYSAVRLCIRVLQRTSGCSALFRENERFPFSRQSDSS